MRKEIETKKEFIIGGKSYIPDEDILLCVGYDNSLIQTKRTKIYATEKGAYYETCEDILPSIEGAQEPTSVKVIDKEKALEFMDENAAGIEIENYKRIFGEPERG